MRTADEIRNEFNRLRAAYLEALKQRGTLITTEVMAAKINILRWVLKEEVEDDNNRAEGGDRE